MGWTSLRELETTAGYGLFMSALLGRARESLPHYAGW